MQFVGQTHLLRVPLPTARPDREELQRRFEAAYHARFRVDLPTIRANLVNLNTRSSVERPAPRPVAPDRPGGPQGHGLAEADRAQAGLVRRLARHAGLLARSSAHCRSDLQGPAIIEQMDTTIVIDPGDHVTGHSIATAT
jgi:N-methylhydantoinase A